MFIVTVVLHDNSTRTFKMDSLADALKYIEKNYPKNNGITAKRADVHIEQPRRKWR